MRIRHLALKNWRNFKSVEIDVPDRLFVVGPNASGKSNLLDALRFLRDVAAVGGGLQQAVRQRGGLGHVRCLAAHNFNRGRVGVEVGLADEDGVAWSYEVHFTGERRGRHRPVVVTEIVRRDGELIVERPDAADQEDQELLTQTALEQVQSNREFRDIADFLNGIRYRHLVPQIIRDPELGRTEPGDPYGSDFLEQIAKTPKRTRSSRLSRVNSALRAALPQLHGLDLTWDEVGSPHLEARYEHWRTHGAIQKEREFSDGTLRLIALLWLLAEKSSKTNRVLLLEEPELSLHPAILRELPTILSRVTRRDGPQVILSTHSSDMLADRGIGLHEVVLLKPGSEGTTAALASDVPGVADLIDAGMDLSEIIEPLTRPHEVAELSKIR